MIGGVLMAIAYLGLGSNIGDKVSNLEKSLELLTKDKVVTVIRSSAYYETEPWGNKNLDWFVNSVIEVKTKLTPQELLNFCKKIEQEMGRDITPKETYEARIIDIDILVYGDLTVDEPNLKIPHVHIKERAFWLVPLLELIPDYEHPKFKKSLLQLHEELENVDDVYLYGTGIEL